MLTRLVGCFIAILGVASYSFGIEVGAVIRKIDVENKTAHVFANGKERTLKITDNTRFEDENGKALDGGIRAAELKEDAKVTLNVEVNRTSPTINSIRLGGKVNAPNRSETKLKSDSKSSVGKTALGFKPLTEMTADDRYKGEDGGLYGGGKNEPPEQCMAIASKETKAIGPLDRDGKPASDGKIGVISISMSNATQEYSTFKQIADADPQKSPLVSVVDCAQGGQTMARWSDPKAACWTEADRRLQSAGVSLNQVQVAWVKLANAGPSGELHEHGKQLDRDTRIVLSLLKTHFPNVRIVYLGSRIYGGYADGRLNPEPFAYEGAFVARWLIQSQIKGDPELNCSPELGPVKSPLLLWGPYFWADGMTPRKSDGLIWERSDLAGDGAHPSNSGRMKVAEQLLTFFKTDPHARTWFVKK